MLPKIFPVTCHTDHVGQGTTFVAIRGYQEDGTKYIKTALERGATHIVVEYGTDTYALADLCYQHNATYAAVSNTRQALATLSAVALDHPANNLTLIGITGTAGKSSMVFLIDHILRSTGHKTAILSTVYNKILDASTHADNTTPESDYLQMFFAECVKQGVSHVIMEVSSHALSLDRVHGVTFNAIGFTNLSPEHLDFHKDMNDYFAAKAHIFNQIRPYGAVVINCDNEWGIPAFHHATPPATDLHATVYTFGAEPQPTSIQSTIHPHIQFSLLKTSFEGTTININSLFNTDITCPSLMGKFNGSNLCMASIICHSLDISTPDIVSALATFPGIPGRLQRHILQNGAYAFVDYAHKPGSFQEVLSTLRPHTSDLIVVFGCGGNRDTAKRPVMGGHAAQYADKIIVTNDNPRNEDEWDIINQILAGIPESKRSAVICQPDRRKAIADAVALSKEGSIIAILGKGHEDYVIIQGKKYHLDDFEEISKF